MSILDLLVYHQLNVYQTWHWYIFVLDLDPKDPILCSRKQINIRTKSRSTYQKKKKRTGPLYLRIVLRAFVREPTRRPGPTKQSAPTTGARGAFVGSIFSRTRWDYSSHRVSKVVMILTLSQENSMSTYPALIRV